jgi:peptidyl-prolyl cis-trans isomerase C
MVGIALRTLPAGKPGVRVNGITIPRDQILRETQFHPAHSPIEAWTSAARALVVRELLLQEARRLEISAAPTTDDDGRQETDDEASIRALIERQVTVPTADSATCRRYYQQHRHRFRSPDIYEAAHILFSADQSKADDYLRAREAAAAALGVLREHPEQFAEVAAAHSACSSAAQGGNLGQISAGQTTPEFELALMALEPGAICAAPVATRYGFHVIRLDRKHDGRDLPFELVADRIAAYLEERIRRQAMAQYISRLADAAAIEGIEFAGAAAMRVNQTGDHAARRPDRAI